MNQSKIVALVLVGTSLLRAADQTAARVLREVDGTADAKPLYIGNRAPLAPSPFKKLPIGSIEPRGWLLHQLESERDGMIGHLKEISPWLNFEKSAWGNTNGAGSFGWEELPYWLKGYGDLGYVLKDEKIIAEARKWIDSAIGSQRADGWFGPRELLTSLDGKPGRPGTKADLWPNMVMLNILQTWHEYSGDPRVPELMRRYFQWENALPATAFGQGYWPRIRAGDNIDSIYWLYNRTGEAWLLPLAQKIHEHMQDWSTGVHDRHNVNIAQAFREPTIYWQQAREEKFKLGADRNYREVMSEYGQFPGGGFAGDENYRPGFTDPRQGFETCGIVEFMHSFEMLTKITGHPIWSDRCENLAFNSLPAALTPDQKALHYLTCANVISLDKNNKAPDIQNGGTMFSYSPFEVYRCCQHNVSHGWPYYAEEIWLATHDRGLCASLYAESAVRARVGDGTEVQLTETTDYPFSGEVKFKLATKTTVKFPLYLRVPGWCEGASVQVNGRRTPAESLPLSYLVVNREWRNGDTVALSLPMRTTVQRWAKQGNAVSVSHGPLTYSLAIQEEWKRYGKNANWPEWEVTAGSPWNYGLVLNEQQPEQSFDLKRKSGSLARNPWTAKTTPLSMKAKARRIPNWQADKFAVVGKLQPSPVKSEEKTETVTLIPMGAARLRITTFPVIGTGEGAREWEAPKVSPIHASHVFTGDTVEAVNDGKEPARSNDTNIPRFTWWDHRGTAEWIEWGFPTLRTITDVEVYWFDDTGRGQCRAPQSWRVLYRVGERWTPVANAGEPAVALDKFNRVTFAPVECNGVRIEAQLQPGFSAGILEWKVE